MSHVMNCVKYCFAEIGIKDIADRLENGQNMKLDVSQLALDCLSEKGYDVRYGARPLKRVLAQDILNPLSRLVLEGAVLDGDTVRVRTRGEVEKNQDKYGACGYISSSTTVDDKNAIVILRNHENKMTDDETSGTWDDEEFLLEDGTHRHR